MKRSAAVCLYSVLGVIVAAGQTRHPALENPHSVKSTSSSGLTFSIQVRPERQTVLAGTPVEVKVTTTNTANMEIALSTWSVGLGMVLVHDGKGEAPLSRLGRNLASGKERLVYSEHLFLIDENKSDEVTLNINSGIYDLGTPGQYQIQLQRTDPFTKQIVKSNVVSVTVK